MKKIIKIVIVLFLVSSILEMALTEIINNQIISRILYGTDYNTYVSNYYEGFVDLISGKKIPYEWVFSVSRMVIMILSVIAMLLSLKCLKVKNTVNKKEFSIIMVIFSILSLYYVIAYMFMFFSIPPIKFFVPPIIFIISAYCGIKKMLYLKDDK